MNHLQTYQVFPNIPEAIGFLEELSRNLWWSWEFQAIELFRRIEPRLWEKSGNNPILFLTKIPPARLDELAIDSGFLAHQQRVKERFEARVTNAANPPGLPFDTNEVIAYFSMEFGIHESIPLFAGGLGVLAGDHLKAASSMALPLVGVGLLYRRGYFRQFLDHDGRQQEVYPPSDLHHLPLERVRDTQGNELVITVPGPDGDFHAAVWKIQVGRIPLFLLDADLRENPPEIRDITANLYAGDPKTRLAQEVLLGIGGIRALIAMGIVPKVSHMNEGHSAFSSLERLSWMMSTHGVDVNTALEMVPRTTIFTTHTPVPAGHDEFPAAMVSPILKAFETPLDTSEKQILSWGQPAGTGAEGPLSMFVLGLRMSQYCNGVSRLHGQVARKMWADIWPQRPVDEIPISHITNGVHIATWSSPENAQLFERYVGPEWYLNSHKSEHLRRIGDIYDEELWRAHEMARSRLIANCRERMLHQYGRRNAPASFMEDAATVLDQDVLTIGFARRFATYKRATLLLQDPQRLESILNSPQRPVQIIFAGKAHPRDNEGKEFIRQIVAFARRPAVRHRIVFLEDYNMSLARLMVQGADVWLNTPRRPLEACGTSGMKAAINGVLNVSILDGWWAEAYSEDVGWCIGCGGESPDDPVYQDAVDANALYNTLENDVIPAFYERKNGGAPLRWIKMMKSSIKMSMENFCSLRMIGEYSKYYLPAAQRLDNLTTDDCREAQRLAAQDRRLRNLWKNVWVEPPLREGSGAFRVGDKFHVTATVHLGELLPEEVDVQLYYGQLKSVDMVMTSKLIAMTLEEEHGNGDHRYGCQVTCTRAGRHGFTARITPRGDAFIKNTPGMITWA